MLHGRWMMKDVHGCAVINMMDILDGGRKSWYLVAKSCEGGERWLYFDCGCIVHMTYATLWPFSQSAEVELHNCSRLRYTKATNIPQGCLHGRRGCIWRAGFWIGSFWNIICMISRNMKLCISLREDEILRFFNDFFIFAIWICALHQGCRYEWMISAIASGFCCWCSKSIITVKCTRCKTMESKWT